MCHCSGVPGQAPGRDAEAPGVGVRRHLWRRAALRRRRTRRAR